MSLVLFSALYSTDPRFSDSYGDQDPFDGPSNGPSNDPPEPEWPKDVPIRKGDILYMMFQRPENDKEANTAHEKPMKRLEYIRKLTTYLFA